MEVVEYASEHDEVKDLLDMKKTLKWGDEDEKYLERLELIQKKWLKRRCSAVNRPEWRVARWRLRPRSPRRARGRPPP